MPVKPNHIRIAGNSKAESLAHIPHAVNIPDALINFDHLPDSANGRLPVVMALYACSSATVWRRVKDGRIPQPKKFGDRLTAWNVGELRRALSA